MEGGAVIVRAGITQSISKLILKVVCFLFLSIFYFFIFNLLSLLLLFIPKHNYYPSVYPSKMRLSLLAGVVAAAVQATSAAVVPRAGSSFSFSTLQDAMGFSFSTNQPGSKNWIGLYHASGGGPDDQKHNQDSLTWSYARWESGNVEVDTKKLGVGSYKAYYLKDDGYQWLADPMSFDINFAAHSTNNGNSLQFDFVTDKPNSKNWVGLYPKARGGPEAQKQVEPSPAWAYVSADSKGSVTMDVSRLAQGQYKAFFLKDDGYEWLAPPVNVDIMRQTGSLQAYIDGGDIVVNYNAPKAASKNWVGIYYAHNGGPVGEVRNAAACLTWKYVGDASGSVRLPTKDVQAGMHYKAYLLADDGYKWLSEPTDVYVPGSGDLGFFVDRTDAPRVKQGTFFTTNVAGLLKPYNTGDVHFSKTGGASWVTVFSDGTVSGTPSSSGDDSVTIQAKAPNGNTASMQLSLSVTSGDKVVDELRVLSFNIWEGGKNVNDPHRKQVQFLANSGLDIVGLQESTGGHANRLAEALGWYSYQGNDAGIISRYPIVEVYEVSNVAGGVRVKLSGSQDIKMWNAHPTAYPYGPYGFCFDHKDHDYVMNIENQSGRPQQMDTILNAMRGAIGDADKTPVILTGDMNAPSHLDWVDSTRDSHCGATFDWPTSTKPIGAGLMDSFRQVHNDPRADPGNTWSPIYLDNGGTPEPMDRIDFVYYKGMDVTDSRVVVVGQPRAEPNQRDNDWPSDHASVRSTFRLKH